MFNADKEKIANKIETLIGEQCSVVGTLSGEGILKIDGCIEGDILWQDDIILSVTASCLSNITCKNAYINGKVDGNIICEGTLTIESCGKIIGDITVRSLAVKEGGTFEGKCTMVVPKHIDEVLE